MTPQAVRVYIAGPISGLPDGNRPAFAAAADMIRRIGAEPIDPHHVSDMAGVTTWRDCMIADLAELIHADAVFLLPGWSLSRGAKIEADLALALAIPNFQSHEHLASWLESRKATA